MEATGAGGLTIESAVANAGATILVGTGSTVSLQGATIIGGTLKASGTGAFFSLGATFDGTTTALTTQGPVNINDDQSLAIQGSIINSGTIAINSAGSGEPTTLSIAKSTTLSGAGKVVMTDFIYNQIAGVAAATTLTNVDNTISGAGTIGGGPLTFINKAAGIVDATGASVMTLNTGANTIANAGLIEATGAGGLTIQSAIANTANIEALGAGALTIQNAVVTNTGGLVTDAAGGHVSLRSGTINGGTLTVAAGGLLSADSGTSALAPGTFTNAGAVMVNDNAALGVGGLITNSGTITVNSGGSGEPTALDIAQSTTLSGAGHVNLTDFSFNQIAGGAAATTLTNVNNTISGSGTIGSSTLTLVNQAAGIIDATGTGAVLILNTGTNTITNAGLIEATGSDGLTIESAVANAGGTIEAGNSSTVALQSVTIAGGTLKTIGTGAVLVTTGATFDGTASVLANQGLVVVDDAETLSLAGSIANSGTIKVDSLGSGNATTFAVAKNTTLSGKGAVVLTDFSFNQIVGGGSATTLTNVDNTISGSGTIGSSTLTLVNQAAGIIDATGTGSALILNTGANTIANAGLIENTGTAGLTIDSAISNTGTLLAHTGTLTVVGPLTNVSGTTLTGGTYEADAGATLELPQNTKIVTDKATIILNGSKSTIEAFNTTSGKEVAIDSTLTTIAAAGALEILGGRNWTTKAAMSNAGLLELGGGTFTSASLANTGTISGFGVIVPLIVNSGSISAQAGKTLTLQGGISNLSGTTLTGGVYVVGAGATLQLANNVSIVTLAATVDLAGVGATLQSLNTGTSTQVTLDSTLTTITAAGALEVLGGRGYTTTNAIGNSGLLQLGGSVFTSGVVTDAASASLTGFGTLASVFSEAGTVKSSGGALGFTRVGDTFTTALGGTEIDFAGGTDLLESGSSLTATTVGVLGGAVVTLGASQTFAGKLTQGAGTVDLAGGTLTLTGSGSTIAGAINGAGALAFGGGSQTLNSGATIGATTWSLSGGAAVTVNDALTYAGTFSAASGTTLTIGKADSLTLSGASTFATGVGGATGTLALSGAAAMSVTASITVSGALSEASGTTITIGSGDTLTLSGAGSALSGSVGGAGATLAVAGGTTAINTGASLSVSTLSLTGGTTTLGESLTYAGVFNEGAGATLTLTTADKYTLSGATTLSGTVNGASTLKVSNATVNGLIIGGTADLDDTGTVDQTGAITVGDKTSSAAILTIAAGATYAIQAGGIAIGKAATSSIKNSGTLTYAGTGEGVIALKTLDAGSMVAASGTMDFAAALTGTGSMTVDSGATLEVDSTAAATLSAIFNGADAILALNDANKFAATINGFAATDTIDLLGQKATTATLGAGDALVIKNGAKVVATLQLAGTYTGDTFNVASDGNGGSNITVTTGGGATPPAAIHPFIAAMAWMGGNAGVGHVATGLNSEAFRPMIVAPRMTQVA
jgi:fibronectin-binding autotransporter adhesin